MKQTAEQKRQRNELLDLTKAKNRALSALSFKHIKTYEDFLVSLGHNRNVLQSYYHDLASLSRLVTRQDIIAFFQSYETELQQRHAGVYDKFTYEFQPHEYEGVYYDGTNSVGVPANIVESDNLVAGDDAAVEEQLPISPKQNPNFRLFPFQTRAAIQLLDNILKRNMRAQLLRAGVGTGKTVIIGAVIRRLLDTNFLDGRTFSPWPIVYITKATIVRQTERELERKFGIDTVNEVKVVNIEQLRTTFGELMLDFKTVIKNGEEVLQWVWRPGVHPCIFLIDECQIAKNNSSQQSQIIQAIADIQNPNVFCIFFSATPFMTVAETKALVLNMHLNVKTAVA